MAALPEYLDDSMSQPRRLRYGRSPEMRPVVLTPPQVWFLRHLAATSMLSLPQAALLMDAERPGAQRNPTARAKSARRLVRPLFDGGLVDIVPVGRAAFADPEANLDPGVFFGSGPNVYTITHGGLKALYEAGLIGKSERDRAAPSWSVGNALYLRHELQTRDVYVWLVRGAARAGTGYRLLEWRSGASAAIALGRQETPKRVVPDAWFALRVGEAQGSSPPPVLVGLVEVDRGTERGTVRWREKAASYAALFTEGTPALQAATGYARARVLIVTPDGPRRDSLAALIPGFCPDPTLAGRFWMAEQASLGEPGFSAPMWKIPGSGLLRPLIVPILNYAEGVR